MSSGRNVIANNLLLNLLSPLWIITFYYYIFMCFLFNCIYNCTERGLCLLEDQDMDALTSTLLVM